MELDYELLARRLFDHRVAEGLYHDNDFSKREALLKQEIREAERQVLSFGYRLEKMDGLNARVVRDLSDRQLRKIAKESHERERERLEGEGWSYSPEENAESGQSPRLRRWDKMTQDQKDAARDTVADPVALLENVDIAVVSGRLSRHAHRSPKRRKAGPRLILFLVEGHSDITALAPAIERTLSGEEAQRDRVAIRFVLPVGLNEDGPGGDITTKRGFNRRNIENALLEHCFRPYFGRQGIDMFPLRQGADDFHMSDLCQIVQIADTDGFALERDSIEGREEIEGNVFYDSDNSRILCRNPDGIEARNKKKKEILGHLCSMKQLSLDQYDADYAIFFFSCNREHFFGAGANLSDRDKYRFANAYATYCEISPGFFKASLEDEMLNNCTYEESWKKIMEGNESIARHSNLGIYFT